MPTAHSFFQKIDTQDLDGLAALLADDARMVFANGDPMVGREAVLAGNIGFFSTIKNLRHRLLSEWSVGTDTIAETEVTYTRLDNKEVSISGVTIWQVDNDDLIIELRIYGDLTPVFEP